MTRPEEKLKGTLGGVVLRDFAKDRPCDPVDAVEDSEVREEQEIGSNQNMESTPECEVTEDALKDKPLCCK